MENRVARAALFSLAGGLSLVYWLLADPGYDTIRTEWRYVLLFSCAILALGVALRVFGSTAGGRAAAGLSLAAGVAAAVGSLANIAEDGLGMGWAFWGFVASTIGLNVALLALTVAIAFTNRGSRRLLALVPAATLVAILCFVPVGGILMLATWLIAAAATLAEPVRTAALESTSA